MFYESLGTGLAAELRRRERILGVTADAAAICRSRARSSTSRRRFRSAQPAARASSRFSVWSSANRCDGKRYRAGSGLPSASHVSSATVGTNEVHVYCVVIASTVSRVTERAIAASCLFN